MTSQQAFTGRRRSYVFILNSEHNSNHFRVAIADFKQEKVYLDSFFWLWNYIHLRKSFFK